MGVGNGAESFGRDAAGARYRVGSGATTVIQLSVPAKPTVLEHVAFFEAR